MLNSKRVAVFCLVIASLIAAAPVAAQETPASSPPRGSSTSSGLDRLFLGFIEDTALADRQWWEGQVEYADFEQFDLWVLRFVAAFQPVNNLEIGGRVGFGDTSSNTPGFPEGNGATDFDLWGKWRFGQSGSATEFSAGGVLTIPTGDDSIGLGFDAFALEAFGAVRHRMNALVINGRIGLQQNGDGRVAGFDVDGKLSALIGGGVLWATSSRVSLVGEAEMRTERLEGGDPDIQVLGGVNWRPGAHGVVRGAISVGLDDGAPDFRVLGGFAYTF